jgi:hypothetical protein
MHPLLNGADTPPARSSRLTAAARLRSAKRNRLDADEPWSRQFCGGRILVWLAGQGLWWRTLSAMLLVASLWGCAQGISVPDARIVRADASGLDARAPGVDAPGLDAPGRDAPGLDAPSRDPSRPDAHAPTDAGCGTVDGACCAGTSPCMGILVCRAGRCRACGRSGDPCCAGDGCNAGLTCAGGVCTGCGARGETCCPGAAPCAAGSRCVSGSCVACECTPGERREMPCALCGTRVQTCLESCTWGPLGECAGMGECEAGAVERVSCERCGTRSRTCSSTCRWGLPSACTGMGECEAGTTSAFVGGRSCGDCSAFECDSRCRWSDTCSACTCSGGGPSCMPCPSGYHPGAIACSASCGFCSGYNQVDCAPDCGRSFTSCAPCPRGYHAASFVYSPGCGPSAGTNADRCEIDDASFTSCRPCPSGYRSASFTCAAECGPCIPGGNQVLCERG